MSVGQQRTQRVLLGGLIVLAVLLFVLGVLQANAVREWLNPSHELRLVLPDEGLFGLSEGARIEILGTPAGTVTDIVIDPDQNIHATARINPELAPFVRRDSRAVIRKTFGVAGESFLEITRGQGEQIDWDYAVLSAEADRAPTDSIGEILEDVRSRVMPILEQTDRAVTALADLTESLAAPEGNLQVMLGDISALTTRIEGGEGTVGRLLANDAMAREFETLLGNANETVSAFGPILTEITALSQSINAQSEALPDINTKVNSILASLDDVMRDLRQTSPELPKITRDVSTATASVPVLIGMTQQTLAELESLVRQLRSSWLLGGGGGGPEAGTGRLPPHEVRP